MKGISSGDWALEKSAEIYVASCLCNTLKTTTHHCTPLWTIIRNLQDLAFSYEQVLMQVRSVMVITTSTTIFLFRTLLSAYVKFHFPGEEQIDRKQVCDLLTSPSSLDCVEKNSYCL